MLERSTELDKGPKAVAASPAQPPVQIAAHVLSKGYLTLPATAVCACTDVAVHRGGVGPVQTNEKNPLPLRRVPQTSSTVWGCH